MVALYSWTNLVNSNSCVFIVALESFHPLDEGKARKLHPICKKNINQYEKQSEAVGIVRLLNFIKKAKNCLQIVVIGIGKRHIDLGSGMVASGF